MLPQNLGSGYIHELLEMQELYYTILEAPYLKILRTSMYANGKHEKKIAAANSELLDPQEQRIWLPVSPNLGMKPLIVST